MLGRLSKQHACLTVEAIKSQLLEPGKNSNAWQQIWHIKRRAKLQSVPCDLSAKAIHALFGKRKERELSSRFDLRSSLGERANRTSSKTDDWVVIFIEPEGNAISLMSSDSEGPSRRIGTMPAGRELRRT